MDTHQIVTTGYSNPNGGGYAPQPPMRGTPPWVTPPTLNPCPPPLPLKNVDSFKRIAKKETTEASTATAKPVTAKTTTTLNPTPAKPTGISTGVAVLGGLALFLVGGASTYFAGKKGGWWQAEKSLAAKATEALPQDLVATLKALGFDENTQIEQILPVIQKLQKDIETLKTEHQNIVAELQEEIRKLGEQLDAAKKTGGKVAELNVENVQLKQELKQAEEKHKNQQQIIAEKEKQLATLQAEYDRLKEANTSQTGGKPPVIEQVAQPASVSVETHQEPSITPTPPPLATAVTLTPFQVKNNPELQKFLGASSQDAFNQLILEDPDKGIESFNQLAIF